MTYPAPARTNEYVVTNLDLYPKLLSEKYDNQFKQLVASGWCNESDGEVDSPTGFFALLEIPADVYELHGMLELAELSEYVSQETGAPDGIAAAGWYVTQENDDGLIYVFEFASEDNARQEFNRLKRDYHAWKNGVDQ